MFSFRCRAGGRRHCDGGGNNDSYRSVIPGTGIEIGG